VITADSGEKALQVYREQGGHPPSLIIMDLGMPGMGGVRCLKAILQINHQAKVLIASGYAADAQVKEALAAGAAGYVGKPFRRQELLGRVRAVLDGSGD
jgi:DNA-binding NarL/FixJ family response regulator